MTRYAYWRRPDTTLDKPVDSRHAPTEILRLIGENANVSEGSISWPIAKLSLPQLELAAFSSLAKLVTSNY